MPTSIYTNSAGVVLPSVTTILSKFSDKTHLQEWARNLMRDYQLDYVVEQEAATSIGTLAHEMVERELLGLSQKDYKNENPDFLKHALIAYSAWGKWKSKYKITKILGVESKLVSEKYQFGGCADLLFIINHISLLLDLKTSKSINIDYLIQLAAYKYLWNENYPKSQIEKCAILRLDKITGKYEYYIFDNLDLPWKMFKILLLAYKVKQEIHNIDLHEFLVDTI